MLKCVLKTSCLQGCLLKLTLGLGQSVHVHKYGIGRENFSSTLRKFSSDNQIDNRLTREKQISYVREPLL